MKPTMLWIVALVTLGVSGLCAQDISENWQRTLKTGIDLRLIVEIVQGDGSGWKATMSSIDQTTSAIPVNSATLEGSSVKFTVDIRREAPVGVATA